MIRIPNIPDDVRARHAGKAWPVSMAGAALLIIGSFLSWCYDDRVLGDLSIRGNPGGLQILAIVLGVLTVVFLLVERGPLYRLRDWADAALAVRALGLWSLIYMVLVLIAITIEAGGLVNINEGGWISTLGALLIFVGSRFLPQRELKNLATARLSPYAEIAIISLSMAAILFGAAYALSREDAWEFVLFLVFATGLVVGLVRSGFTTFFGHIATRNKKVLTLAAFAVAFFFPFTQQGSDANMSIATQVLIFAATAMGLNIVVGLAGLLDLGYIAFLGAGAYVAAILSGSAFATLDLTPPFWLVVIIGAVVSSCLGLIIGSPTLRVSGDYLAIVTLAFGEIFRLAMFNLDGNNGPDLTNGPNGIPGIPDLQIGNFNFGDTHTVLGVPLGRFSNYYFLLLVLIGFIILVFSGSTTAASGAGGWPSARTSGPPRPWASTSSASSCSPSPAVPSSPAWRARSRPTRTARSARTSTSSSSRRSCSPRSSSAAWARSPAS